ncbi:MAG: enoyl-CoA hydratase/isomerase family protein [Actinomycetota bacterium]
MLRLVDGLVRVQRVEELAVMEIHRPERANAMSFELVRELLFERARLSARAELRGLVITGSGGAFSSGADISEDMNPELALAGMRSYTELFELVTTFPRPTVAS